MGDTINKTYINDFKNQFKKLWESKSNNDKNTFAEKRNIPVESGGYTFELTGDNIGNNFGVNVAVKKRILTCGEIMSTEDFIKCVDTKVAEMTEVANKEAAEMTEVANKEAAEMTGGKKTCRINKITNKSTCKSNRRKNKSNRRKRKTFRK